MKKKMLAYKRRGGRRYDFMVFAEKVLSAENPFECPQFPVFDLKTSSGRKLIAVREGQVSEIPDFSSDEIKALRDKVGAEWSSIGVEVFAVEVEIKAMFPGYGVFADVKEVA